MKRFHIYCRLGVTFMDDWTADANSIGELLERNEISKRLGKLQGIDWLLITVESDQPSQRTILEGLR